MNESYRIAGYCRISVDEELERDNTSIENQKAIIADFVRQRFPGASLTFFEDRDRSGYTFEQREDYQRLRRGLMSRQYHILIVKDFSRFSRRNSRGLVELEDLRDAGVRIISVVAGTVYPNDDDWLKIQFQFLINEMPVTDTSKKVRSVVRRRQQDGQWICAAPYGYQVGRQKQFEVIPAEAEVVRQIYALYNSGWGYKKIANHLTELGIPTPRMSERLRREAAGEVCRRACKNAWAIVTVQGILDNDFYTGTLRQGKYTRAKINGRDIRRAEGEQIVIPDHHPAIVDGPTFSAARAQRERRSVSHYRGQKKYENAYSGFLVCGDCGSPMFSMSRADLRPAYTCGAYHRRGRAGCTSHHIRVDTLDEVLKTYVGLVRDRCAAMLEALNADLERTREDGGDALRSAADLETLLADLQEELKATKRQRVRDLMKHPDQEELLEETYGGLEQDLLHRIDGVRSQLRMAADRQGAILRANRAAPSALALLDKILRKPGLDRQDLQLILEQARIYEDHIEVHLKANVDALLRCAPGLNSGEAHPNFKPDMEHVASLHAVQSTHRRTDRVFHVHVVSDGDPLEIYTDKEGGVIFRKYSLMGGLGDFAVQLCEALNKTTGRTAVITDRDACLAAAGSGRRELSDKAISPALEQILEDRGIYQHPGGQVPLPVCRENGRYFVSCAAPVLSEGDVLGCVLFAGGEEELPSGEIEYKLLQTISGFLGRHMES